MENDEPKKQSTKPQAVVVVVAALLIMAAIGLLIWVLSHSTPSSTDSTQETTQTSQSTSDNKASTADTATITFTESGFSPSTLTVKSGTVVTVVNNSSRSVQFSSDDHPTHREDPEINMAVLAPGEKGTFTATTTGTHSFHDHLDDSKVGTLIVTK